MLRRCVTGVNARDVGHNHKSIIIKTRWGTQNVAAMRCRRKMLRRCVTGVNARDGGHNQKS